MGFLSMMKPGTDLSTKASGVTASSTAQRSRDRTSGNPIQAPTGGQMEKLLREGASGRLDILEARVNELDRKRLLADIERNGANGFTFSDRQDKRIREIFHDEGFIQVGKITVRGILLAFGAAGSLVVAGVLAFFGVKR